MEILIIAALIGLIPAAIAKGKGRSFGLWWLYGALIFIVALPHALIMRPDEGAREREAMAGESKKCPSCAEMVKGEARVCRFCGNNFER